MSSRSDVGTSLAPFLSMVIAERENGLAIASVEVTAEHLNRQPSVPDGERLCASIDVQVRSWRSLDGELVAEATVVQAAK